MNYRQRKRRDGKRARWLSNWTPIGRRPEMAEGYWCQKVSGRGAGVVACVSDWQASTDGLYCALRRMMRAWKRGEHGPLVMADVPSGGVWPPLPLGGET